MVLPTLDAATMPVGRPIITSLAKLGPAAVMHLRQASSRCSSR